MSIINDVRVEVWQQQEASFTSQTARIEVDGSIVPTTGGQSIMGWWRPDPVLNRPARNQ